MGPSGSGKTTLLNIIAGRGETRYMTGSVFANGEQYNKNSFSEFGNYVMQNDYFPPTLTVREILSFAADLTITGDNNEKELLVDSLIRIFKLDKCENTVASSEIFPGISGGEKRRTSIAFELVLNPKVLLLDELKQVVIDYKK